MDNTDTLIQCGLGFTCDFEKPDGFLGQERVQAEKAAGVKQLPKRLCSVLVKDPEAMLYHGEIVYRDGKIVGDVRAGSYGHTLGGSIGLTMIEPHKSSDEHVPITKAYIQVTNQPRFSFGFLATLRLTSAHPCTAAAAQAPPNDAPTLSPRSSSSESPVKHTNIRPKTSLFFIPCLHQGGHVGGRRGGRSLPRRGVADAHVRPKERKNQGVTAVCAQGPARVVHHSPAPGPA